MRGKVRMDPKTFNERDDKYIFEKLSKKEQGLTHVFANVVNDPQIHSSALLTRDADEVTKAWQKFDQSKQYLFQKTLNRYSSFKEMVYPLDGRYPEILGDFFAGDARLEELVILDIAIGVTRFWDDKLDDPLWTALKKKIQDYKPFIKIDKKTYRTYIEKLRRK